MDAKSGEGGSSKLYKALEVLISQLLFKERLCREYLRGGINKVKRTHAAISNEVAAQKDKTIRQYGSEQADQWLADCKKAAYFVIARASSSNLRDERLKDQIVAEATLFLQSLHVIQVQVSEGMSIGNQPLHFGRDWGLPGTENMNLLEKTGYDFFGGPEIVNIHRFFRRAQCDHEIQFKRLLLLLGMALRKSGQMSARQERNGWLYELAVQGRAWKEICELLSKRCNGDKLGEWDELIAVNGVKDAVKRHQQENPELPPIKTRQPGRPRKGTEIAEE